MKLVLSIILAVISMAALSKTRNTGFPISIGEGVFDPSNGHIQGICCSEDAFYLSQMSWLYKFDWSGRLITKREVLTHTGDITFYNNEIYSAVSIHGGPNKGMGKIVVFDKDLNFSRECIIDRGVDGLGILNGVIYLGMGSKTQPSREPHLENVLGRFDSKTLKPLSEREFYNYGCKTRYGAQNIVAYNGCIFISFYPATTNDNDFAKFDSDMNAIKSIKFKVSNGFDVLPECFSSEKRIFVRSSTVIGENKKIKGCIIDTFDLNKEMKERLK